MSPKEYVLGFAFHQHLQQVILIEKRKPIWQRGLLNGVGGLVEKTDWSPMAAMEREFMEETGLGRKISWQPFARFSPKAEYVTVHCFASMIEDSDPKSFVAPASPDPELCYTIPVASLLPRAILRGARLPGGEPCELGLAIYNVPWLVSMAAAKIADPAVSFYNIAER